MCVYLAHARQLWVICYPIIGHVNVLWVLQCALHNILLDSRRRQHILPPSFELATTGSGGDLKNIAYRYVSTSKEEIVKTDKADPNIMEYMVIVLQARSGTRKGVPGKVIGLLWIDVSHGMV